MDVWSNHVDQVEELEVESALSEFCDSTLATLSRDAGDDIARNARLAAASPAAIKKIVSETRKGQPPTRLVGGGNELFLFILIS